MDEAGGVEVKEGFCHLIEDVFSVSFGEDVFADECEEIDVHVFEDEIDISVILGADHLLQFDYIGMGQFHQEHYLAIGPLCVGGVIECVKIFLECFDLSGFFIGHLPDVAVGAASDFLVDVEAGQDVRLYLLTH